jgi:hypothetical protein
MKGSYTNCIYDKYVGTSLSRRGDCDSVGGHSPGIKAGTQVVIYPVTPGLCDDCRVNFIMIHCKSFTRVKVLYHGLLILPLQDTPVFIS